MFSKSFVKIISTFFYVGFIPFIPGTAASLVALLIFLFIKGNPTMHVLFILFFLCLGSLVTGKAEKLFGKKDPSCVVIDEILGMFISLMLLPYDIRLAVAGFVIFRILDIIKPYPANKFQLYKGSLGIMSDDIVAGIYTNIILQFVTRIVL